MTLTDSPRINRRWPLALGALVVAIALVAGTVLLMNRTSKEPGPPTPPTATNGTPVTSASGQEGAQGARGCLGGVDPTKAILQAQQQAAITPKGAAEFVGTFVRWTSQYPADPNYDATAAKVIHKDAGEGVVPRGEQGQNTGGSAWATTVGAKYRVEDFTSTEATVSLIAPITGVQDGTEYSVESAGSWRLRTSNGRWQVFDLDRLSDSGAADLRAAGMTYQGAC